MGNTPAPASDGQGMTTAEVAGPTPEQITDLNYLVRAGRMTMGQEEALCELLRSIGWRMHNDPSGEYPLAHWSKISEQYAELIATLD